MTSAPAGTAPLPRPDRGDAVAGDDDDGVGRHLRSVPELAESNRPGLGLRAEEASASEMTRATSRHHGLNSCRAWSTVARMRAQSTRGASATLLLAVILTVTAAGESQAPEPYQVYQSAVAAYVKSRDISRAVRAASKMDGH